MSKIQFLGAAGEVTGSSFLLTNDNNESILIDLGMFQGTEEVEKLNYLPLKFDPKSLKYVLLTHAHLDHCGRLPLLVKGGFNGKIYATAPTKSIAEISLYDSAKIASENLDHLILYTASDVEQTLRKISIVDYNRSFKISDWTVTFHDAGHILGSASIEIKDDRENKTYIFSGDLGNTPQDLIRPTEYIDSADVVIMESTYGGKVHPEEDALLILQQEINTVEKSGGTLLIPAFSVERTQEVLHKIGLLKKSHKINTQTPVFLDSPMAIEVTDIFKIFMSFCNQEIQNETTPFDFTNLITVRSSKESKAILDVVGAKVIIAGSGMMNGGRILHHLADYISIPSTRLLVVGYQAEETLGREILDGAKKITIEGENFPVQANITDLQSLSSHADQPKLLNWLKAIKGVTQVFIVHGEDDQRSALSDKIKNNLDIKDVQLPLQDQIIEVS